MCRINDLPGPGHYNEIVRWLEVADDHDEEVDLLLLADFGEVPGLRADIMEEENLVGYDWYEESGDGAGDDEQEEGDGEQHAGDDHDDEIREVYDEDGQLYRPRSAWLGRANRGRDSVVVLELRMGPVSVMAAFLTLVVVVGMASVVECIRV